MSGAVAAHAAYNGAGTQGLAVTNKINDTGDISSVFWTKNDTTRQLLHGSSIVEVVSSGTSGVINNFGSSKIFTVNNDVDVLGDLYLQLDMEITPNFFDATVNTTARAGGILTDFELDHNFQYKLIDRVEFMVGTQIWHTVFGNDIKVLNTTYKPESCEEVLSSQIASERFLRPSAISTDAGTAADDRSINNGRTSGQVETVRVVLWIPALSSNLAAPLKKFYNITESGYLMAAAPQQSVKIKVTFATNTGGTPARIRTTFVESGSTQAAPSANQYATITGLAGNGTLTAAGSTFDFPTVTTIYPFRRAVFGYSVTTSQATREIRVDISLGRSRLFAKQIMLCKEERDQIRSVPNGLPYRVKMSQSVTAELPTAGVEKTIDLDSFSLYASHLIISGDVLVGDIIFAELKLNSSSFSGNVPSLLLRNDMAESLHLYSGRTLVHTHVEKNQYTVGVGIDEIPVYIFPLASSAFSGSSVPLNRFDSIRLTLRFNGTTAPTVPSRVLSTPGITVTCVGETTILYKGGAATLAMY